MDTLSYGYKKPVTGDRGSVFFPGLEDTIDQLNSHSHNGVDSALVSGYNISKGSVSIANTSWVSEGNGNYYQSVNLTGGYNVNTCVLQFKKTGSLGYIYPTVEFLTTTSVKVIVNDNTLNLVMLQV